MQKATLKVAMTEQKKIRMGYFLRRIYIMHQKEFCYEIFDYESKFKFYQSINILYFINFIDITNQNFHFFINFFNYLKILGIFGFYY